MFTQKLTRLIAIHGDKQQHERDWVLNEFKTGKSPIMVATDVASRGIGMISLCSPLHCFPVAMVVACSPCVLCDALCCKLVRFHAVCLGQWRVDVSSCRRSLLW